MREEKRFKLESCCEVVVSRLSRGDLSRWELSALHLLHTSPSYHCFLLDLPLTTAHTPPNSLRMSDNQLGVSSFSSFASVKKPVFRAVSLSPEPDQDLDGPSLLITPNPMTPLRAATLLAASKILVSSIFS